MNTDTHTNQNHIKHIINPSKEGHLDEVQEKSKSIALYTTRLPNPKIS